MDGTDLFDFVDRHTTWDGYLTDMEQDGTWGDHVILWAAANCYQIAIHVISSLPGHSEVIINPDCPFDQSKHLVLGHVHEVHYVSLQPLQGIDQKITHLKIGLLYLWILQTGYFKYYYWVYSTNVFYSYTATCCTGIYELPFHKNLQSWLFWFICQQTSLTCSCTVSFVYSCQVLWYLF